MTKEELRRKLANKGVPLTPDVVNSDNEWLDPIGPIGHVSEVNGEDAKEVSGFIATRGELVVLVKYWMTQIIDYDFWLFRFQQTCSSECRRSAFGSRRIERIRGVIGDHAVTRAVDETFEEYGRTHNSEAWHIYRHGTEEERRAFRAECDAAEAASAKESDEKFCADLQKYLAGEPHEITPGTVGMEWAKIAKSLLAENPAVASGNLEMLLNQIRRQYFGDSVSLDESRLA